MEYICTVCEHLLEQDIEGYWEELSDNWLCPECESPKELYAAFESFSETY